MLFESGYMQGVLYGLEEYEPRGKTRMEVHAMIFVCYPKCTTCQKARKWLEENGIAFEERHIRENNPTIEELKDWRKRSGLPLKKFFNTSGQLYKELKLKDRLPSMSEEEQYRLLASDGMMVKRPILIGDGFVLVGFNENEWKAALGIR